MLTVIIPAAGKGTRLNLPYPKEILRLDKEQALIDYSFDFFQDYGRKDVEFVIVVNEDKMDVVRYVSKYKDRYNVSFTFQNPAEQEYTGAIKSAKHLFGKNNIVLLPDTVMTLRTGVDLGETVIKALESTGFTFFYKPENDPLMLRTKGAIFVDKNGKVTAYEDKPMVNFNRFNGYWCSFAFTKEAFNRSIAYMERSTLKMPQTLNFESTPLCDSKSVEVLDYRDLGTWDEIRRLLRETV